MINCLIVEDEPLAQELLQTYVDTLPNLTLLGIASDVFEAQAIIDRSKPDLIFLDINLPQVSGIDWLRSLNGQPINVIITTADELRGAEAFDLNVIHYLRKPITMGHFMGAINRYRERTQISALKQEDAPHPVVDEALYVKDGRELVRVALRNIMYVESQRNYLKIHQEEKKPILTLMTIKSIEARLPSPPFYQMNRTFIVRNDCVERINGNQLTLCDGQTVQVTGAFQTNLHRLREHIESNK
jgi:DNA-binding LytR/AlgR family response regulator